jgi:hypothetical protein
MLNIVDNKESEVYMSKTNSFSTNEATAEKLDKMATNDIRSPGNFLTFLIA